MQSTVLQNKFLLQLIPLTPSAIALSLLLFVLSGNNPFGSIRLFVTALAIVVPVQVVTILILKKGQNRLTKPDLLISGAYLVISLLILMLVYFPNGNTLSPLPIDFLMVVLLGVNFVTSMVCSIIIARKKTLVGFSGPLRVAIITLSFITTLVALLILSYLGLAVIAFSLEGSL